MNGNSREIEAALQEHRIDLGLVEGVFRLPNLKYSHFLDDELVAVVHTKKQVVITGRDYFQGYAEYSFSTS